MVYAFFMMRLRQIRHVKRYLYELTFYTNKTSRHLNFLRKLARMHMVWFYSTRIFYTCAYVYLCEYQDVPESLIFGQHILTKLFYFIVRTVSGYYLIGGVFTLMLYNLVLVKHLISIQQHIETLDVDPGVSFYDLSSDYQSTVERVLKECVQEFIKSRL